MTAMTNRCELIAWLGNSVGKPPGFERIVRWFASPEKCRDLPELCLLRENFVFLARPGVQLDWHLVFFGTFESEIRRIFRTLLPIGGVALDVGANVGWHTLLMASLVGANGRVLAVEANPAMRQRLCEHLRLNHLANVEIFASALADAERTVQFYAPSSDSPDTGDGHVIASETATPANTIRVQARPLDAIAAEAGLERLDLIKIDVEGFEWPVLQGGRETITRFRPHIIFEHNAEFASRGGATPEAMAEFFRDLHYRLFAIRRNWAEAIEGNRWPRCADIWAVPK